MDVGTWRGGGTSFQKLLSIIRGEREERMNVGAASGRGRQGREQYPMPNPAFRDCLPLSFAPPPPILYFWDVVAYLFSSGIFQSVFISDFKGKQWFFN